MVWMLSAYAAKSRYVNIIAQIAPQRVGDQLAKGVRNCVVTNHLMPLSQLQPHFRC